MGSGGGWGVPPCAPSALTQIVPISASIYTVFHSVIFNPLVPDCTLKYGFSREKNGGTYLVITPLILIRFSKFKQQQPHRNRGHLFGKF